MDRPTAILLIVISVTLLATIIHLQVKKSAKKRSTRTEYEEIETHVSMTSTLGSDNLLRDKGQPGALQCLSSCSLIGGISSPSYYRWQNSGLYASNVQPVWFFSAPLTNSNVGSIYMMEASAYLATAPSITGGVELSISQTPYMWQLLPAFNGGFTLSDLAGNFFQVPSSVGSQPIGQLGENSERASVPVAHVKWVV